MNGVSVILCCHNSARRLPETLRHLSRQVVSGGINWEVLVVDNASTDDTAETAVKAWPTEAKVPLRVVVEPKAGLSHARERGVEDSRYEYLLFCDDDNWLAPSYVEKAIEIMNANPGVALAGGWGTPVCEIPPPRWFHDFAGPYGTGPQGDQAGVVSPLMTFYGAGAIVRKTDYRQLLKSGFRFFLSGRKGKKLTTGEDRELGYAFSLNGKKLYYDPELKFQHFIPKERATFGYYRRMMTNCVPAGLVLQSYQLKILSRIDKRAGWKNSYPWILAMMVLSQVRRAIRTTMPYLAKGYAQHCLLEWVLVPQTLWVWLSRGKEFIQVRKTLDQMAYVRI